MENPNVKKYDLEDRTFAFAEKCSLFLRKLPKTISNFEYGKQLVRSSGSVAANYIEANESLSKKDYALRVKICRKEAKESCLWLRLCFLDNNPTIEKERTVLVGESRELTKIFGSIVEKIRIG